MSARRFKPVASEDKTFAAFQSSRGHRSMLPVVAERFREECFVAAVGNDLGSSSHEGATLAAETAIWGYQHIRKRQYYWEDRRLFMKRIVKTVNLRLFQLQKDDARYKHRLFRSELVVAMTGERKMWCGLVGRGGMWRLRHGKITHALSSMKTFASLGLQRKTPQSLFTSIAFAPGDVVILTTKDIEGTLMQKVIDQVLQTSPESEQALQACTSQLHEYMAPFIDEAFGCWVIARVVVEKAVLQLT